MKQNSYTVADRILDVFRAYGVDYIFSSPGSEWAALWDALARAKAEGLGPRFLNTRHEELAVSLALGYYQQTKKLSAVVLHATVGPLHAAMALWIARLRRVPMVVLAGTSAGYGEMPGADPGRQWARWLNDASGPAALVQSYVKRSSTVTCREVLPGMLQDACRLALTPPYGPVLLSVPFEFTVGEDPVGKVRCAPPPLPAIASSSLLEDVAAQLIHAERPVLVTECAGQAPGNVQLLVDLAEMVGMPVVEPRGAVYLNFPRTHPLHLGFESEPLLGDADLVLLVASQTPWYPVSKGPKQAKVIVIDDDPGREFLHYWGYGVDQVVGGDLTGSLEGLVSHARRLNERSDEAIEERRAQWCAKHDRQRADWQARASAAEAHRPISGSWAASTMRKTLPPDAIVVEETVTHKMALLRLLDKSIAGTYHNTTSGGLGTGLGWALGLKLAAPERLVVFVVGDGSFNYNPIVPGLGFAQQFGTPILIVVMNNRGYAAMKGAHLEYFPAGWSKQTGDFFGTEIEPAPDYAALVRAFDGFAERVDEPAALQAALHRAIDRVNAGQMALLDVIAD